MRKNPFATTAVIVLVVLILLVSLIIANVNFALRYPGGNDFMVHWAGFRNLLTQGISPYTDATNADIQAFMSSGLVNPRIQPDRVVYPLYSLLLYLPFALIQDFALARAIWMTILELSLVLLAYLGLKLSGWKPNTIVLAFYYLFAVLFFHSIVAVMDGSAAILVAVFLAAGLVAVKNRADELAGVLFAFSAVKPHVIFFFAIFLVLWSIRQRRKKIAAWFGFSVAILALSCMLIIPDWIPQNLLEILRYLQDGQVTNFQWALGEMLPGFGGRVGWAVAAVLLLLLLVEWGLARRFKFKGFLFAALVTLLAAQWMGFPTDIGNYVVLFPIFPVIFEAWNRHWQKAGGLYASICLLAVSAAVPLMYIQTIGSGYTAHDTPILYLPIPLFLLTAMYWSRWWILQPDSDLPLDGFRDEDMPFFE